MCPGSDLSDENSTDPVTGTDTVEIVGQDGVPVTTTPSGTKQLLDVNIANIQPGGPSNLLHGPGVETEITVGTAAVEVKVGASRLTGRKLVTLQPFDADMYWGYTSGVTVSTGTKIFKSQMAMWDADDVAQIWVVSPAAGKKARVTESA